MYWSSISLTTKQPHPSGKIKVGFLEVQSYIRVEINKNPLFKLKIGYE